MKMLIVLLTAMFLAACSSGGGDNSNWTNNHPASLTTKMYVQPVRAGLTTYYTKLTVASSGKYERLTIQYTLNQSLDRYETTETAIECGTWAQSTASEMWLTPSGGSEGMISMGGYSMTGQKYFDYLYSGSQGGRKIVVISTQTPCNLN